MELAAARGLSQCSVPWTAAARTDSRLCFGRRYLPGNAEKYRAVQDRDSDQAARIHGVRAAGDRCCRRTGPRRSSRKPVPAFLSEPENSQRAGRGDSRTEVGSDDRGQMGASGRKYIIENFPGKERRRTTSACLKKCAGSAQRLASEPPNPNERRQLPGQWTLTRLRSRCGSLRLWPRFRGRTRCHLSP